jgi:chromosome segregation protein
VARAAREAELAGARAEYESRTRDIRSREHGLAGMSARLRSLEEIDGHRSGFADAARLVLVSANGKVGQMGAVADFLEVEPRYERAVEACLGDLLQHVLVERLDHVSAGLKLIRQEDAGRCGFIVGRPSGSTSADPGGDVHCGVTHTQSDASGMAFMPAPVSAPSGTVALSSVVRVAGPFPQAIAAVMGGALIADSFDTAAQVAPSVPFPVATLEGDVFRGRHVVTGGDKAESRGILATKREIKELREQMTLERRALDQLVAEAAEFEQVISQATAAKRKPSSPSKVRRSGRQTTG